MRKKNKKYEINLEGLTPEQKEIGYIIDMTNYIEKQLKKIISHFIQPNFKKSYFVEKILLHNNIIDLGGKLRIYFYICKVNNWKIKSKNAYHNLLRYRNGFAHNDTTTKKVDVKLNEKNKPESVDIYMTIDNLTFNGFKSKRRDDMRSDFIKAFKQVDEEVHAILSKIKKKQ